jgi:D-aminopeptidase
VNGQKRIRDYGVTIGRMEPGPWNSITDVPGVLVGNVTLCSGDIHTGVTAVLPHAGNLYEDKAPAACQVFNGFGKSAGLMQIEELGTIETPIILTNTLSVGSAANALVEYMLTQNPEIGRALPTVNPVVCECNDGYLNDIRGLHVTREHVFRAIETAEEEFEEGAVGAGAGMSCFHLKGGIGTASRRVPLGDGHTLGVLALTNFGVLSDLMIAGIAAGKIISNVQDTEQVEKGSVILIIATDIPLSTRQLKRIARRASVGLARTGAYMGHGSGELSIAFSTANRVPQTASSDFQTISVLSEGKIDTVFRAVVESVEEAVLNSMVCASPTSGRDGHFRHSLDEYMDVILEKGSLSE